jgi:hypothetical protein
MLLEYQYDRHAARNFPGLRIVTELSQPPLKISSSMPVAAGDVTIGVLLKMKTKFCDILHFSFGMLLEILLHKLCNLSIHW